MKEIITNSEIVDLLIRRAGVDNQSQLAAYLTDKYQIKISRQQINQFKRSEGVSITHLLLREAIE